MKSLCGEGGRDGGARQGNRGKWTNKSIRAGQKYLFWQLGNLFYTIIYTHIQMCVCMTVQLWKIKKEGRGRRSVPCMYIQLICIMAILVCIFQVKQSGSIITLCVCVCVALCLFMYLWFYILGKPNHILFIHRLYRSNKYS